MRALASLLCLPLLACVALRPSVSRDPAPGPVLFTVTDPAHPDAPLSLLGTVHLESADYRLDRAVEDALAESRDLYVELDVFDAQEQLQRLVGERGRLPEGQTLSDVLSPDTLAALREAAPRFNLDASRLMTLQPWLVKLTLAVVALQKLNPKLRPDLGIDRRVLAFAHEKGLTIHALETVEQQVELLSYGDSTQQDAWLRKMLEEIGKKSVGTELVAAWERGDLPSLERQLLDMEKTPGAAEAFRRVWVDRNAVMFNGLRAHFLTGRRGLVAVGAGHLLGESGLVQRFERAGFRVERATSKGPGSVYVAPWVTARDGALTLSWPATPKRTVTPVSPEVESTTSVWASLDLAFAVERVRAPQLPSNERALAAFAKGRTLESSEATTFLGQPAVKAVVRGASPEMTIEVVTFTFEGQQYSVRAVWVGARAALPRAEFDRFFESASLR